MMINQKVIGNWVLVIDLWSMAFERVESSWNSRVNQKQLETPDNWTWIILSQSIHVNRQLTTKVFLNTMSNSKPVSNPKPTPPPPTPLPDSSHYHHHKNYAYFVYMVIAQVVPLWKNSLPRPNGMKLLMISLTWYVQYLHNICIENNWTHWDLVLIGTLYIAKFKIDFVSWKSMMDVQWMLSKLKRIWRWYSFECHLNVLATKGLN
jgi:hypothetical protein